jgi:CheY-like chemotaxis protein
MEILVIDDDAIALYLHQIFLKENFDNTTIKSFNSALLALDYLNKEQHSSTEYLVLLDINMPIMTGWGFLEAMQQHAINLKLHIIMVTSSLDTRDKERAKQYSRVIDFCEKPINDLVCQKIKLLPSIQHFF